MTTTVKLGCFLLIGLAVAYVANAKVISSGGYGHRFRSSINRQLRGSIYQPPTTLEPPQHSDWWWPTPDDNVQSVTPGPSDGTETRRPYYGGNRHQYATTPDPTDDTETRRPYYGIGGNYRPHARPTPGPTDDTETRRPYYGGNRHQYATTPDPTADTFVRRSFHEGNYRPRARPTPDPTGDTETRRPIHEGSYRPRARPTSDPTGDATTRRPTFGRNRHEFRPTGPSRADDTTTRSPSRGAGHHQRVTDRPYHQRTASRSDLTTPLPTNSFQYMLQRYLRTLESDSAAALEKKSHNDVEPHVQNVNCPAGRVPCRHTGVCIDTDWICDGENDCLDWSDEEKCSSDGRWGRSWQTSDEREKKGEASEEFVEREQMKKDVVSELFDLKRRLSSED